MKELDRQKLPANESYFYQNLPWAQARVPAAAGLSDRLSSKLQVLSARTGERTARYDKILLHSTYDPVREGREFARRARPGDRVCVYGFGLGYHVRSLLDQIGPQGRLLVIELQPDLLSAALTLKDQTPLLRDPRLRLVYGTSEPAVAADIAREMTALKGPDEKEPHILFHGPSFKLIPPHFPRLIQALEILLVERRFPFVLGDQEADNFALNRNLLDRLPGINTLRGTEAGRCGVLAAAGPSLDDAFPYLKRVRSSIVLACVDTALPILSREGLVPDYVFSLDPQEESFRHFTDHLDSAAKLIVTPTANARLLHCFRGDKFVVFKEGHPLNAAANEGVERKGVTRSGGSVACLGVDGLIQLGCDPIILAGQDCAHSGHRVYSRHSRINQELLDAVNRTRTLARSHRARARKDKPLKVGDAWTNTPLYTYLRTLETLAATHPEIRFYNLCSHGAPLDRIPPLGSVTELIKFLK